MVLCVLNANAIHMIAQGEGMGKRGDGGEQVCVCERAVGMRGGGLAWCEI